MFTMAKIRDGRTYLGAHLTSNDYYCENESVAGHWIGLGAERLGLQGQIQAGDKAFEALRQNRLPDGTGKLTPRDSENRVKFFDFQCSAQKSVSVMAVTLGDTRLLTAHDSAALLAFGELEKFAARQANTALARVDIRTASVAAASFRHTASRALDPQVHTHFVTANATWDEKAKGWRALTEFQMVKAVRYAGKVYQNEMARACRALGYSVAEARDSRGTVTGFELSGVPSSVCKRFSKRRAQIEREITKFREDRGREPSPVEVHAMTVGTRDDKLAEITTSKVLEAQRRQLTPEERAALENLKDDALSRSLQSTQEATPSRERESLQAAMGLLYERRSVVLGHELLAEALNQNLGHVDLPRLKSLAQKTDLIGLTDKSWLHESFATRGGLESEQWSVGFVDRTRGTFDRLGREAPELPSHLSPEQRAAAMEILASRDQVICFRGAAGVGKTTVLSALWTEAAATGNPILACAPTSSGVDTLRKDGLAATTLTDLLQNIAQRGPQRLAGALLIVDESGLASNRQGAELLRLAERHSARVLFIGDTRQHSAVEAGDFLRVLESHSSLHRVELSSIRRQEVPAYRDAVCSLAAGATRVGLEKLDALGWVKEGRVEYLRNAAADYLKLLGSGPVTADVLAVTPTWAEHNAFTREIRARLKERGTLEEGNMVVAWEPLKWTRSQTADARNYEPGMIVSFNRSLEGFKAGHAAPVNRLDHGGVWVMSPQGERRLPLGKLGFSVARAVGIEIAPGDRLLIRANDRSSGLINGERVTVAAIAFGRLRFTDGRSVDTRRFGHFIHGYAVTSHASQSKTVDHVVVVARQLDAKAAYVACSRARLSCTLHTPDKAALMDRIAKGDRPAALDLLSDPRSIARFHTPDRARIWTRMRELSHAVQRSAVQALNRGALGLRNAVLGVRRGPLTRARDRSSRVREQDSLSR
jgi:conjugative relaxase-like TrwC/TraI family protein